LALSDLPKRPDDIRLLSAGSTGGKADLVTARAQVGK